MNPNENARSKFKEYRRRWVDKVMRDTSLSIATRLVGYGIAVHLNRDQNGGCENAFGATYTHPSSLARELGIKFKQCVAAIQQLVERRYITVVKRGARNYFCALGNDDLPELPMRSGGREFARERAEWLDLVMLDKELNATHRAVAYLVGTLTDPATNECAATCREIAGDLDVSPMSASTAIKELRRAGWLMLGCDGVAVTMSCAARWPRVQSLSKRCPNAVQSLSNRPEGSSAKSGSYDPNLVVSVDPVVIPSPSDSAPSAARNGHDAGQAPSAVRFESERTLQLWCDLFEFLESGYVHTNCNGEPCPTIGGIIRVSNDYDFTNGAGGFSADQVAFFVRAGLLARRGKRITITALGQTAYEHGYVGEQKQEAA